MTSITSVELNYLIFRYLQESGFTHSAFSLGYEAGINKCPIDGNSVPPGALVTFVQKGLQYLEMEANLSNSDTVMDEDFSFLQPLDLITKNVYELRQMINERRKTKQKGTSKEIGRENEGERGRAMEREKQGRKKGREKEVERIGKNKQREKQHQDHIDREMVTKQHHDQTSRDMVTKQHQDHTSREMVTKQHQDHTCSEMVAKQHQDHTFRERVTKQHQDHTCREMVTKQHQDHTFREIVTEQHQDHTFREVVTKQHQDHTDRDMVTEQHQDDTDRDTATKQHQDQKMVTKQDQDHTFRAMVTKKHQDHTFREMVTKQHQDHTDIDMVTKQHQDQKIVTKQHQDHTFREMVTRQHQDPTFREMVTKQHQDHTDKEIVTKQHQGQTMVTKQHQDHTAREMVKDHTDSETVTKQHQDHTDSETVTKQHQDHTYRETVTKQHQDHIYRETVTKQHQDHTDSEMVTKQHQDHAVRETVTNQHQDHTDRKMVADQEDQANFKHTENGISGGPEPMDISTTSTSQPCQIPNSDVLILEGHASEVCACAWNPAGSLLASGSGDSTARIWTIADRSDRSSLQNGPSNVLVLKHAMGQTNEKPKDVTTLDWNWDGTLLATGSYDGQARIWSSNGEQRIALSKHKGPIFSIKWNKKGDYLLTGSCDTTAIVWDVRAGECKQQFNFHSGPTLDLDWRNNDSFATSSTDHMIYVCQIGENRPIKAFSGHQGEVNCVKWDPTGSLLASGSDDITAKIWSMKHDNYIHDLRDHVKEIYTIRWSPTGSGTNNPNKKLVMASASFDSTVKLWDVELGRLLISLNGHRDAVYALGFSPDGEYLASGSLDRSVHVWSLKEGKIVKTYTTNGSVFDLCWNKEGNMIAAASNRSTVSVLDFRM